MKYLTKVAIIVFSTWAAAVILSVTLIVVLTRPSAKAVSTPTPTPQPVPTTTPVSTRSVHLKDSPTGQCYVFTSAPNPTLGTLTTCDGRYWVIGESSPPFAAFNGLVYEACIAAPTSGSANTNVVGTTGPGCNGVQLLSTGVIQGTAANLCIQNNGGVLTWGASCSTSGLSPAFAFTVVDL